MTEVFEAAFQAVNLPYTILMIVLLVYWLIAIVGLIDLGSFDLDIDVGGDGGADLGGDLGGDMSADGHVPVLHSVAGFFNAGEVPIMFWVSIVALSAWVVSMQVNHYVNLGANQIWLAAALAVPNVIFGMFVAKLVIQPFKNLTKLKVQETPLVGKTCQVVSLEVSDRAGQCEVRTGAAPLTLSVCTVGGETLRKGETAVIVERDKRTNIYTVTRYHEEAV
jgi:hypothetical protein